MCYLVSQSACQVSVIVSMSVNVPISVSVSVSSVNVSVSMSVSMSAKINQSLIKDEKDRLQEQIREIQRLSGGIHQGKITSSWSILPS